MTDTRETLVSRLPELRRVQAGNENGEEIAPGERPPCRFEVGDRLIMAMRPEMSFVLGSAPYWDYEFGGWLLTPGLIGVHESNYIFAYERDKWEPHAGGLWSYWTRKEEGT